MCATNITIGVASNHVAPSTLRTLQKACFCGKCFMVSVMALRNQAHATNRKTAKKTRTRTTGIGEGLDLNRRFHGTLCDHARQANDAMAYVAAKAASFILEATRQFVAYDRPALAQ